MSIARLMQMAKAGVPSGSVWTDPDLANASYDSVSLAISGTNFTDVFFKPDGTMFFAADSDGIDAYNLSTAWDLSSSSAGSSFSSSGAFNVYFKSDGTRVFWVENTSDSVKQGDLSSAWDLSTVGNLVTGAPSVGTIVRGIRFSSDGTKMYAADRPNTQIEQFNLSTAWDISSSSASSSPNETFSVGSQASQPAIYAFNPDGTKMWVTDASSDSIYEYNLSTAWSVSSAAYASISFDLSSQDVAPIGGQFKADGSKMYIAGAGNDSIYQYSTSAAAQSEWTDPDLANASYDSVSAALSTPAPNALFIKPDGTKAYITGGNIDAVKQFSLSTAWDASTLSYDGDTNGRYVVSSQTTYPTGVAFSSDGTKMFVMGYSSTASIVYQYSLSTAWDVSSASYDSVSYDPSADNNYLWSLAFSTDGSKLYTLNRAGTEIMRQYSLSTSWDLSSVSYDSKSLNIYTTATDPRSFFFNPDGTKLWVLDEDDDAVYEWALSTGFDISTATYNNVSFYIGGQDTIANGLFFKDDGSKMYVVGSQNDNIYQYSTA